MKPVSPYKTLFGEVLLDVVSVIVDGAELPYAKVSKVERTIALHETGREKWEKATIRVKASLPEQEITKGPWSDIQCLAVLSESATNSRRTARLTRGPGGDWEGTIELVRSRHSNRASLAIAVVATIDSVEGRIIGTTEKNWYADLRASRPLRQQEIEIIQVDFSGGPLEWLRGYKDALWIVETTGEIPKVYLNTTAVDGLLEVMNRKGGTPEERLLRETTASQIAHDAWAAMFQSAISELDEDDEGNPVLPVGWRGRVLRMMLPDVLPGRQLADALYEILKRRTENFGWSELQTGIHYAAGKRSRITKKLTDAVRSVRAERNESR
ncbi:hypothetical protein [Amycolatopsis anabasis]|uniref:hypothetical protein n=1 Tax=Amycolatopsis anabasis TaxID=1840409 RepID=UPI00131E9DDD|nr:hypothetical protein [Amycolatopsis anabasis]